MDLDCGVVCPFFFGLDIDQSNQGKVSTIKDWTEGGGLLKGATMGIRGSGARIFEVPTQR